MTRSIEKSGVQIHEFRNWKKFLWIMVVCKKVVIAREDCEHDSGFWNNKNGSWVC